MLSKICKVFTKQFRKEMEYYDFMEKIHHRLTLKDESDDLESEIQYLILQNFTSTFKIKIGDYN